MNKTKSSQSGQRNAYSVDSDLSNGYSSFEQPGPGPKETSISTQGGGWDLKIIT